MIWLGLLLLLALGFGLGAVLGAPYLPIWGQDAEALIELAGLKSGQTLLDLGSGDGKLLKAAAARGIYAIGFEINPVLCLLAWWNCRNYRPLVKIRWTNFWWSSWPEVDVVYVFLIDRYMSKLDQKAAAEIKKPTQLISYVFQIPGRPPVRFNKNTYVYSYPIRKGR